MTRKTTGACLALLAVAAMAAWAAPAQAELEFQALETLQYGESEEEQEDVPVPATLDAAQVAEEPITIHVGEAKISCTTATATGTLSTGSSPTLDLAPSYSGCKLGGTLTAEVSTGGCSFHVDLLEEVEATLFSAQTDIVCPGKSEILITVKFLGKTACLINIPAQTGLKTVKAITMAGDSPGDFTLKHEINTLKATVKNGGIPCFPIAPGEYTKAELTGSTLVTANGTGEGVPPVKAEPKKVEKIHFAVEKEDVWIVSNVISNQVFGFDVGKVECSRGTGFQRVESPTKKLTVLSFAPEKYEECKHPATGKAAEVLFNECSYELLSDAVNKGALTGSLKIPCKLPVMKIEIKEFCTIRIPEQLGPNEMGIRRIAFYNGGSGKTQAIKAEIKLSGIEYEEKNETGTGCVQSGLRKDNGTMTGTYAFEAFELEGKEEQVGLWVALTP